MTIREATKDQINTVAETGRNAADEAVRVGQQAADAGSNVLRHNADAIREGMQVGLNTGAQNLRSITDQVTQVLGFNGPQAEETARRATQNVHAVTQASSVLARGIRDASQEWLGLAQERVKKNMDGLNRLAGCRSVQDFVAVQSDLLRGNLQQVIDTNRRFAEVSLRIANEATRAIQAQADQSSRAA